MNVFRERELMEFRKQAFLLMDLRALVSVLHCFKSQMDSASKRLTEAIHDENSNGEQLDAIYEQLDTFARGYQETLDQILEIGGKL